MKKEKGGSKGMAHGDGYGKANVKGGLVQTPMGKAMNGKKAGK